MATTSAPAQTGPKATTQTADARSYLEKHKIEHVMQQLMTALLHQKPTDPRSLMIKKLEEMKAARARNQSLSTFSKDNLAATFRIFDVTGRGYITMEQYHAAMKDLGVKNYTQTPVGHDKNQINMDTFVDIAFVGLLKPDAPPK